MNILKADYYKQLVWLPILAGLFYSAQHNYLLFHSLTELFSVIVACGIFVIAWNSRRFNENHYLLFIGIAYLFVAMLDLLHTLSYSGMNIFTNYDSNLPVQLWIVSRYMESLSLLCALFFIKRKLNAIMAFSIYLVIFSIATASVFYGLFPVCYIEGSGLTQFKIVSEYLISATVILVIMLLFHFRTEFEQKVWRLLVASMIFTILAELAFTVYIGMYDFSNMVGHVFKVFSFYLIYKAVIETSLSKPYDLLYRNLKTSEERFRYIYDNAPLAFIVWDRECRITDWNRRSEDLFGWKKEEVSGKNFFDIILPESARPHVREVVDSLLTNRIPNRSTNENITKEGEIILCEWNNVMLYDNQGQVAGAISLGLDITERKKAEEAIKSSSEKIKLFAYSVSHDLKNPSLVLNMLAKNLSKKYHDLLDNDGKDYCKTIMDVSDQIISLVDNINLYITSKENPLKIEEVNLEEVYTIMAIEFSNRLQTSDVTFTKSGTMPAIRTDQISLIRVLRNFIDNALKYGGKNLSEIHIGHHEEDDHHVLSVRDNGVGLNKDDIEGVFGLFKRNITSAGIAGSGLGLAIVKQIADNFKGSVWAEPGNGSGVTFFISISKSL